MSWSIRIPHRDRSEPLDAAALDELPRHLDDPADRDTLRALLLEERTRGAQTIGQVIDKVEALAPAGRRELLDQAREAAGLPPTSEVDAAHAHTARQGGLVGRIERDESGRAFQHCHAKDCRAYPLTPYGTHEAVRAKRWFCEEHRDQAAAGDLDDWSPRIAYGASGALVFSDDAEAEAERQRNELERARERREQRRAESIEQAVTDQRHEEGVREHFRPKGAGWDTAA